MLAIPRTIQRPSAFGCLLQYFRTRVAEAVVVNGQIEGNIHIQGHQKGNTAHKQVGCEIFEQYYIAGIQIFDQQDQSSGVADRSQDI